MLLPHYPIHFLQFPFTLILEKKVYSELEGWKGPMCGLARPTGVKQGLT